MKAGSQKKNMTLYAKISHESVYTGTVLSYLRLQVYLLANFRYFSMEYFTVSIASGAFFHSFALAHL